VFLYEQILPSWALDSFIAHYGIVPDRLRLSSLLTSMFLHGGWLHLIGNMWFLWVFGRNVEDLIGSGRFLLFYILCGLAAGLVQVFFNPYSRVPTVGASGAIAGVMGAYVIKFPRARITTLVPIFVFITTLEIPAVFLLLYWFAIQFFSGVGSIGYSQVSSGGVAWFAHVGGFLAGMLLVSLFGEKQRWTARWDQW
jgi:membrane associated rhomboid family serine protease